MIYLSFVGNHDDLKKDDFGIGPALTIFLSFKKQIEHVIIFVIPTKKHSSVDYRQIAEQNKIRILSEKPDVKIEIIPIDLSNPVDFDLVYPVMLNETQKLIDENGLRENEKIINITSGTPTMTTCWVLLQKSGLIPNAKLIQSFETKYARERGRSTQQVNLEIDDFPQIEAPDVLKRQLTIVSREKEQFADKIKQTELDEKIPELIGQSRQIRSIKEQILYDINETTHVLITGDRGTGKQVVANAIWRLYHQKSDINLTTFDCGTFSRDLIVSDLFGYQKGAFTGATQDNPGILRKCNSKMLFLDEIGNLPLDGQNALLRYVNDGEIRKIGSSEVEKIHTQIIAATNKDINDSTLFAQDLKDRFDEVIELPALKNHKEDIPFLIAHFISHYAKNTLILDNAILKQLVDYSWPGSVRELEKWIQRLTRRFSEGGKISIANLPENFIPSLLADDDLDLNLPNLPLQISIDEYVEKIREKARLQAENNMAEVDRLLKQKFGTEKQRQYRKNKK